MGLADISTIAATGEPLRIAMVAPPYYEVPPTGYGGVETMCADLIEGLTVRGHDVTLIGAGRSASSARFLQTYAELQWKRYGKIWPEVVTAAKAARFLESGDFDVVHDHTVTGPLTARGRSTPTMVTTHNGLIGELADLGEYYRALGDSVNFIAISEAQRGTVPDLNWVATVYNALAVEEFPYREEKEDYVLFLGRISPDKGVHLAIEAAREAGRRIVLAGKCTEDVEVAYFEEEIAPRLGVRVEWMGEVDNVLKQDLLAAAHCLLFPICWEEPFGMVLVEAMACGTPVVALRRGAVPEVVAHGVSGLVLDDPKELAAAIEDVGRIRPIDCRAHVVQHFDVSVMAAGYERVYTQFVEGPGLAA